MHEHAPDSLFSDFQGSSVAPLALMAGSYDLNGYMGRNDGSDPGNYECHQPITVTANTNIAYGETLTKSTCSWAPSESQF